MNIGIDTMGGDFAPEEALKGAAHYLNILPDGKDVRLSLIGNQEALLPYMHYLKGYEEYFAIIPSYSVIGMKEHPTKALKEKPDSSIAIGFSELVSNNIDAFLSAGNTGAMMVGAMYSVKAIEGILRPTIASPIPRLNGKCNILLDVGANSDCKPEHLVQFALMGSLYAKYILEVENPKVGLLNIGEEEGKGNILSQTAYPLLKNHPSLNFSGNIEGRSVFLDHSDVIVCEGFTGNVLLKVAESFYQIFSEMRGIQDEFMSRFNYEVYGGTPILGINAPVIIGHGISNARAFAEMISSAVKLASSNLIGVIKDYFAINK